MKTDPKALLTKDEGELHNLILDFISLWKDSNHASSYTHSMVKSVKSWLAHNGIRITRPIKIGGSQASGVPSRNKRDSGGMNFLTSSRIEESRAETEHSMRIAEEETKESC